MRICRYLIGPQKWLPSTRLGPTGVQPCASSDPAPSQPARFLLDALLIVAGFLVAIQVVVVAVLLVNPLHPIREHFQVTTMATVPAAVWRTDGVVRVEPAARAPRRAVGVHHYLPSSRAFVLVAATVSFAWWACVLLVLLHLRAPSRTCPPARRFPGTTSGASAVGCHSRMAAVCC